MKTKKCNKCGEIKSIEDFNKAKRYKYGVKNYCKECNNKYHKKWYKSNVAYIKKYNKEYHKNNIEKWKKYNKKYYKYDPRTKERCKEYYKNNAEKIKKQHKEYRKNNPEKQKERDRERYKNNSEYFKEYNREWNKNNPEKIKNKKKKRRALEKGALSENIDLIQIYESHNWICGICHKKINKNLKYPNPKSTSHDHIIPLSKGGAHTYSNVQPAHLDCNLRKNNFLIMKK